MSLENNTEMKSLSATAIDAAGVEGRTYGSVGGTSFGLSCKHETALGTDLDNCSGVG